MHIYIREMYEMRKRTFRLGFSHGGHDIRNIRIEGACSFKWKVNFNFTHKVGYVRKRNHQNDYKINVGTSNQYYNEYCIYFDLRI